MNRDQTYVNQILDAINKINAYKWISDEFKESHDSVPWRKMAGIRDVLIHDYDSIDMSIVWNVVSIELPKIMIQLCDIW